MKFGLFGGAKIGMSNGQVGLAADSIGLADYINYVKVAEDCGFSNVFAVEHHFTGTNQVSSSLGLLTYLAGCTTRIRLGTAVVVLPWHNPALLAEQVATLDVLSNGRFDFGVGRGYRSEEFRGFGISMDEAQARFDETLTFLKKAWTAQDRFSFAGKYWRFDDIVIEPDPVQKPHPPIWMAAGSPESIRRAAREGANLLLDQVGSIDLTIERMSIYREEKIACGLPFSSDQVAVARGFRLVDKESETQAALEDHALALKRAGALKLARVSDEEGQRQYCEGDAGIIGTPGQISELISKLEEGGISTLLFADVTGSTHALETFSREVMPRFSVPAHEAKKALSA